MNYAFKSSITGKGIERASIAELEQLLRSEHPDIDLDESVLKMEDESTLDRFEIYRTLLEPLERVRQHPEHHPEGDALYHSLQVFELARYVRSWDEEFLLAALLHDVGKAIDPSDHVAAALAALEGTITPRTAFLIASHMQAHEYADGTLGHRARRRLEASDDFDDLTLLQECDRNGRRRGVMVCTVAEALGFVRELENESEASEEC